jgi:hypothetical protein
MAPAISASVARSASNGGSQRRANSRTAKPSARKHSHVWRPINPLAPNTATSIAAFFTPKAAMQHFSYFETYEILEMNCSPGR